MTFPQAIQTGFRKYADFLGRAARSEFWWWILFTALVSTALSLIPVWAFRLPDGTMSFGPTFSGLWSIAVLLPTLAVAVRRLRDAGYRWGYLFWLLLPVAGLIIVAVLRARPSEQRVPTQLPFAPVPGNAYRKTE